MGKGETCLKAKRKTGHGGQKTKLEPLHKVETMTDHEATEDAVLMKDDTVTDVQKVLQSPEATAWALSKLAEATGVKDPALAARILDQVSRIQAPWSFGDARDGIGVALEMMREMKPRTITEAMLSAQMIGVHHAALSFLHKVAFGGEQAESHFARATSLIRLFNEQSEAMLKLQGRTGQQKVTVEHVHVHDGGQAIVGSVSADTPSDTEGGAPEKQKKTP